MSAVGKGRQSGMTSMKTAVSSPNGAKAIGPYSPAVRSGSLLFVSGQVALDPATGKLIDGDIGTQTDRALQNVGALLEAGGLSFANVVRTTVFLADMNDFEAMNLVYARFFTAPYPARATVQVSRLPRDARVEIDVIAAE
jgi:2-iminobutanoate/2-iminopropanoate deaminase